MIPLVLFLKFLIKII